MYAEPGFRVSARVTPRGPTRTGFDGITPSVLSSLLHALSVPSPAIGTGDIRISTWLPSRVAPKTVRPPTPFPNRTRGEGESHPPFITR